jgi:hypothetical protein
LEVLRKEKAFFHGIGFLDRLTQLMEDMVIKFPEFAELVAQGCMFSTY